MRYAALFLAGFLFVVTGQSWLNVASGHRISLDSPPVDFTAFYVAGKLIIEDPGSLYDFAKQKAIQAAISGETLSRKDILFYYPPIVALAFAPISLLPFSVAYVVMTLINLVCLSTALWYLIRNLHLNREQSTWLVLFAACNYGTWVGMLMGQLSFLALLLVTMFCFTPSSRVGLWVGLLTFKPSLALIPFVVLACQKRWRALLIGLGTVTMIAALSFAVIGPEQAAQYLSVSTRLASNNDYLTVEYARMNGIRALIYYFVVPDWRNGLYSLSLILLNLFIAIRVRKSDIIRGEVVLVMILAAPHLHDHDLAALLTIAVAFLLQDEKVSSIFALGLLALDVLPLLIVSASLPPLVPLIVLSYLLIRSIRPSGGAEKVE
jgi:hypothetical protein